MKPSSSDWCVGSSRENSPRGAGPNSLESRPYCTAVKMKRRVVESKDEKSDGAAATAAARTRARSRSEDASSRETRRGCFIHPHVIYFVFMATLTLFFSGRLLLSLISEPTETEVTTVQQNRSLLVSIMVGDITTLLDLIALTCVLVFMVRYLLAIRARGDRAEYILNGGDRQHLIPYGRGESVFDIAYTSTLPKVAFVLPVKFHGARSQSPKVMQFCIRVHSHIIMRVRGITIPIVGKLESATWLNVQRPNGGYLCCGVEGRWCCACHSRAPGRAQRQSGEGAYSCTLLSALNPAALCWVILQEGH